MKKDWIAAAFVFLLIASGITLAGFKLRDSFRIRATCDSACYPAIAYRVLDDGELCLCGPYTNTGKPKYEVRTLDGGSL